MKKIYVVKTLKENDIVAYATTFNQAKEIANKVKSWVIEERPVGCFLDPNDQRNAWSIDMMAGEKFIPAGTLAGPHDAVVTCARNSVNIVAKNIPITNSISMVKNISMAQRRW